MRRVNQTDALTMRRCVAVVGAAMSLLLIPAIAATAAPSPSATSTPTSATSASTDKAGLSLQLGGLALNVPLAVNIPGVLQIGSAGVDTSTPPTSEPPTSNGNSTTPTPPTSSHQSQPPTSHTRTTSAAPPPPPPTSNSVLPPPTTGHSSSHPSSQPPTTSASTSTESKGTGSLVLTQRLLSNSGQVMIAALLAATAIAVIAFARLGGVRRSRRSDRQH